MAGGGGVTGSAGEGPNGPLYVAPDGSDGDPGTLARPVRTLSRARDLVRTRNGSMTSDVTVYLRGGTYPLTSTVSFSNADSGSNGFYVKYLAYPGERPLLTGGQPITGWKVFDASRNIYSVGNVTARFRQLYVNGAKAIRARSPNLGPNGAANFNRLSGLDRSAHNLQVASSSVSSWNNPTNVEMHLMVSWTDNVLRLAAYTISGGTAHLKLQSPEDAILYDRIYPQLGVTASGEGHCFYFENALEFLDQPGEWYLDETANVLYYKPLLGEDMTKATVVAPMVETLVSVDGSSTSQQAGYLWFQGLTFAHTTYLRPSLHGFLNQQAGLHNLTTADGKLAGVGKPAAGVAVTNANHVRFERNLFTQMAATALDLVSGTHDDVVIGNVFADIGGSGISVGKFAASETADFEIPYDPADPGEICTNDTIQNNYVNNVATEIQGACGIVAGYPRYIAIEHNEVTAANYTGISVGFGWTTSPNAMSDNKINYNNVHHVLNVLGDGAAIYTLSNQGPASEMQYNYVHDFSQSPWADYRIGGLFLDEGTSGYTVAHNVFVNAPTIVLNTTETTNTLSDNSGASPSTIAAAGIEPAYLDIKDLTLPAPTF